jgi:hypothetical protein
MAFGLHYSDTLAGRVFSQATTPVGVIIPIYTTTAAGPGIPLYNPLGSNRNVEVISVDVDFSTTSTAAGTTNAIVLMAIPATSIATGGNVSVFTGGVAPVNGLLGAGNASKCLSSSGQATVTMSNAGVTLQPSATTTQAGPVRVLFDGGYLTTGSAFPPGQLHYDFTGTLIVPPGWMIYMAATIAEIWNAGLSMTWKEVPIVPSQG